MRAREPQRGRAAGWERSQMKHLSEEQIVLHYYGDADDASAIESHLSACADCRAEFARVQAMLRQIEPIEVPEPTAGFEEKTWLNGRDRVPAIKNALVAWPESPRGCGRCGSNVVLRRA